MTTVTSEAPKAAWYAVNQADGGEHATVTIFGAIGGGGVNATALVQQIKAINAKNITAEIDSMGGSVFDAVSIYNALKEHPARVVTHVSGVAASAGGLIAMAGDEISMASTSWLMMHESSGQAAGRAEDMTRTAELLESINNSVANIFAERTKKPATIWRDRMRAETWYTAEAAKAEGLIDTITNSTKKRMRPGANIDLTIYNHVPPEVVALMTATDDAPADATEQNQTEAKPEPQRSEPGPAQATPETTEMADQTPSSTAQTPASGASFDNSGNEVQKLTQQAIEGYIARGRQMGQAEGRQAEQERMRAIVAACPNRHDIAINSFLAGQGAETVKLVYDAAMSAAAEAQARNAQKDVEIARLQAVVATGGHPGVGFQAVATNESKPQLSHLTPEQQAKMEWDSDAMIRSAHASEKTYMAFRVNQLKGLVRTLSRA